MIYNNRQSALAITYTFLFLFFAVIVPLYLLSRADKVQDDVKMASKFVFIEGPKKTYGIAFILILTTLVF